MAIATTSAATDSAAGAAAGLVAGKGRWLHGWDPEDRHQWAGDRRAVARRP